MTLLIVMPLVNYCLSNKIQTRYVVVLIYTAAYWKIAAHSAAYDMFSKYMYLIVNLVFPTSVFGVGISF